MGILPYIFTITRQLNINLFYSFLFFFIFFLLGWLKFNKNIFRHLTPLGGPLILSPILVIIEIIRIIIRPITLSVRLTANIVSGHILIEILLNPAENIILIYKILFYVIIIPILSLELIVCFVQSFVISSLRTLYVREPFNH